MPLTLRRPAAAGTILAAVLVLTGCTQSPAGHDERLSKAAGLARVTIVCPKDLWEETKPSAGANEVKAKISEISTGPRSGRGLVEVSMTGTNLVAYLKELDYNAHPVLSLDGEPGLEDLGVEFVCAGHRCLRGPAWFQWAGQRP